MEKEWKKNGDIHDLPRGNWFWHVFGLTMWTVGQHRKLMSVVGQRLNVADLVLIDLVLWF